MWVWFSISVPIHQPNWAQYGTITYHLQSHQLIMKQQRCTSSSSCLTTWMCQYSNYRQALSAESCEAKLPFRKSPIAFSAITTPRVIISVRSRQQLAREYDRSHAYMYTYIIILYYIHTNWSTLKGPWSALCGKTNNNFESPASMQIFSIQIAYRMYKLPTWINPWVLWANGITFRKKKSPTKSYWISPIRSMD